MTDCRADVFSVIVFVVFVFVFVFVPGLLTDCSGQVNTWYPDAKQRLKKETWETKNRLDDEDFNVSDNGD